MNNKFISVGFDYFGARYYDSDLSVWLSVDPLSEKYPSTSPFMYVRGNPVMLIDPDGRFDDYYEHTGNEGNKSVIYRDGHAASVNLNGEKYTNIGSTYSKDNGDGTFTHYVQNTAVAFSKNSFGEVMQDVKQFKNAIRVASQYHDDGKTVQAVYDKAFDFGYAESSKYAIIGTLAVPTVGILASELAVAAPIIYTYGGQAYNACYDLVLAYELETGLIMGAKDASHVVGTLLTNTQVGAYILTAIVSQMPPDYMSSLSVDDAMMFSIKVSEAVFKAVQESISNDK